MHARVGPRIWRPAETSAAGFTLRGTARESLATSSSDATNGSRPRTATLGRHRFSADGTPGSVVNASRAGPEGLRPLPMDDVTRFERKGCSLLSNVRAEATCEAWCPGAAQDNGACDCPARRQGTTPRGVASRARG